MTYVHDFVSDCFTVHLNAYLSQVKGLKRHRNSFSCFSGTALLSEGCGLFTIRNGLPIIKYLRCLGP